MNAEMNEIVTTVLIDVLERFAFELADPASPGELAPPEADSLRAAMNFQGESQGEIALLVPADVAEEIAANVLGTDPDATLMRSRAGDAIKEVINVVCGQMLTALAGEQKVFDLSIPTVAPASGADWEAALGDPDTIGVQIDERPLLLNIRHKGLVT